MDHPVGVAIYRTVRHELVGSQGYNIPGATWGSKSSPNGVESDGVARIVSPGGREHTERYDVLVGTLSFLSSHGVTVHGDMDDDLIRLDDKQNFG